MYFAYSDVKSPCQMPLKDSHFWWMLQVESLKEQLLDFPVRPEEEIFGFWFRFQNMLM